jgi:hypothetical protein
MSEGTVLHDLHFRKLVAQSGLSHLHIKVGEDPGMFARKLLDRLIEAGVVLELLGCLLIPLGKRDEDWTPDMARETAIFLGGLRAPEDKARIDSMICTLLLDFFVNGYSSLWTSPTSSVAEGMEEEPGDAPAAGINAAIQTAANAMGIGVQSSAS